ncbi:MAG: nucleotidyl transferase AbiEii/AbiGii toxin family protein [Candidatus Omnitrophica bacterium]|nr:nucleotidyl transferase AbiEii/AbiGii toxin family protein [Candidatus Omnitrophota bacterium]
MSKLFDRDTHMRYLSLLLTVMSKTFPEHLAFKGGTCAALFYNLPRFSFDLDFDIVRPFGNAETSLLREIVSQHGNVREFYDKSFTLFCLFDYGKGHPNIKIELNKRLWKNNTYKPAWFMGVAMRIADESTLITNKIIALTNRRGAVARDLYDTWFFLKKGYSLNDALIMERTSQDKNTYLKSVIMFIKKHFTSRNVLQGLGESLDEKQKVWVKAHLINETMSEIERLIK